MKTLSDVSQPSLGVDGDHNERFETPPLSPMFSGGDGSHASASTKSKTCPSFHQKGPGMETHWEESTRREGKLSARRHHEYRYSLTMERMKFRSGRDVRRADILLV